MGVNNKRSSFSIHRSHRTPAGASSSSSNSCSIINNSSNWLKFSNSSVTWARARHQQRSELQSNINNGQSSSSNATNSINSDGQLKRRKFFNTSTQFVHIFSLMLMSLCRQITNRCLVRERLIGYLLLVLIGGLLNDFASVFVRAFIISLSPNNPINRYMVKWAWLWDFMFLFPLITLSSTVLRYHLDKIELKQVEQSIEDYLQQKCSEKRASLASSSNNPNNNVGSKSTPCKIVTLESFSSMHGQQTNLSLMEQYRHTMLLDGIGGHYPKRFSMAWFRHQCSSMIQVSMVKDVFRLFICTAVYYFSIWLFTTIQTWSISSKQAKLNTPSQNELSLMSRMDSNEKLHQKSLSTGFDISGHVFILVYSNLMIIEECMVMCGWEPVGDRLYSLSLEYTNIEMNNSEALCLISSSQTRANNTTPSFVSELNHRLLLAWHRYHSHTGKLRLFFFLSAMLTIVWDFMLIQTVCFYHSLVEKLIALIWAYICWYLTYRIVFPFIRLEVRKVIQN